MTPSSRAPYMYVEAYICPRCEGQLSHMAEPIPHPVTAPVHLQDNHYYPTASGRAETDRTD